MKTLILLIKRLGQVIAEKHLRSLCNTMTPAPRPELAYTGVD